MGKDERNRALWGKPQKRKPVAQTYPKHKRVKGNTEPATIAKLIDAIGGMANVRTKLDAVDPYHYRWIARGLPCWNRKDKSAVINAYLRDVFCFLKYGAPLPAVLSER